MNIIDLSLKIETGMPTCGTQWHQNVQIRPMGLIAEVGRNTHSILVGSHSGTHMDAPYHFIQNGKKIDEISMIDTCGEVSLVDFRQLNKKMVDLEDVRKLAITEKMLFAFGWYKNWKTDKFYKEFPYFSEEAIDYLIDQGMKFIAMDTPSPDTGGAINERDDSRNHKKMLEKQVIIVEYLANTDAIDFSKKYEIYALPLKIKGCDGAPCRVILKEVK